jgi:signal transduction histidine kinase
VHLRTLISRARGQAGPAPGHWRLPGPPAILLRPTAPPLFIGIVVGALAIVVETALVLLLKHLNHNESFATPYLLGILAISMIWGLGLAVTMSVASALVLAYIRDWPRAHFAPFGLEDVVFLAVFLGVALCTNLMAGWARARTVEAQASRDELRVLGEDQAALRRVATLVGREVEPSKVFAGVIDEMRRSMHAGVVGLWRFEPSEITLVAGATEPTMLAKWPIGTRTPIEGNNLASAVLRTGRPARMDTYAKAAGPIAARVREQGVRAAVGVPIIVGGRVWGMAAVGSLSADRMPPDTEARMCDFAELAATAISNAATRDELQASRDSLSTLATQQSALRRVATLAARAVRPSEVFMAVAEEMACCLDATNAEVLQYVDDGAAIVLANFAQPIQPGQPAEPIFPVGERLNIEGENVLKMVQRTGRPARKDDYDNPKGPLATRAHELGMRSVVGAPIVVDERIWGTALVRSTRPEPLPPDTEERITQFAELVATAIAATAARAELVKSRGRIVAAADLTRRRLERNLHDGAQQLAVSLRLQLRMAEESVSSESDELKQLLSKIASGMTALIDELQEISRGIHPPALSRGGLVPALQTLARRSTLPVVLDIGSLQRLPESVEVAAYYIIAEAITNAAKHAQASQVVVKLRADAENLYVSVSDDGIGGADPGKGSGLVGLKDRVAALEGQLEISSPARSGTSVRATIPRQQPDEHPRASSKQTPPQ